MRRMWIFDSYYKGCVELWSRDGRVIRRAEEYPQSFYLYLKDPHAHWQMIEALASRFKIEEISFKTIYCIREGHKIYADRKVAERIEVQTSMASELYNVDMRLDQRYMAERDLFPCGWQDESRFAPGFEIPLSILELKVLGDPTFDRDITRVEIRTRRCWELDPIVIITCAKNKRHK